MISFAQRFRHLRENVKRWTQDEAAEALGVSRSTIAGYESEAKNRIPRKETMSKIAEVFGVSIDYLYGEIDDPTPHDDKLSPEEETLWEEIKKRTTSESEQLFFYKFSQKTAADKRRIMRLIEAMDEADAELE
jgi:transcriptional regulator with XRE-family HTH domain